MSTSIIETHPLTLNVEFTYDDLIVSLVDGRKVTMPLICRGGGRMSRSDRCSCCLP